MTVQGARRTEAAVAPDLAQQLLLVEAARRVGSKRAQQRELLRRQLDPLSAQRDVARRRVDLQLADPQRARPRPRDAAPQQRTQPQQQLRIAEWLDDIVVAAAL